MSANQFVGENYEVVAQKLMAQKIPFRISSKDGMAYVGTADCKPNRYNFDIEQGVIRRVSMG